MDLTAATKIKQKSNCTQPKSMSIVSNQLLFDHSKSMPGELDRIMKAAWTSDQQTVVLEVPDANGKGSADSDPCKWHQLLKEMEESGVTDCSINSHDLHAPMASGVDQGGDPSLSTYHLVPLTHSVSHVCMHVCIP